MDVEQFHFGDLAIQLFFFFLIAIIVTTLIVLLISLFKRSKQKSQLDRIEEKIDLLHKHADRDQSDK
ncbi:DUF4083 domain-containing protein [Virgibacillus sp. W0430]|uniref:DUF4083 domain-containing protein n=1 Tax=Virgibacillus sp. W0430 TaxID=3391580 RepID=UPI003F488C52